MNHVESEIIEDSNGYNYYLLGEPDHRLALVLSFKSKLIMAFSETNCLHWIPDQIHCTVNELYSAIKDIMENLDLIHHTMFIIWSEYDSTVMYYLTNGWRITDQARALLIDNYHLKEKL